MARTARAQSKGKGGKGGGSGAKSASTSGMSDEMRAVFAEIAEQAAALLFPPPDEIPTSVGDRWTYDGRMHGKLCRAKFLGLSDTAAARTCGLSLNELESMRERHPRLDEDMDAAADLATAHAAALLRGLMEGKGPTALQAIKFYLRTHSPEYQEKRTVEVNVDQRETIRLIRENLYGLVDVEPGPESGLDSASGLMLPVLPAESAELESAAGVVDVVEDASNPPAVEPVASKPGSGLDLDLDSEPVVRRPAEIWDDDEL